MEYVKITAPATSANLGAGFDIFGIALREPNITIEVSKSRETTIEVIGPYSRDIPVDPKKNTAGIVADIMGYPVDITIHASIPTSSGLGSSAAPAAATALAINTLYNLPHTKEELVWLAAQGEWASAGTPHADNTAPALLGGFNIVHNRKIINIQPENIGITAVHPQIKISTKRAREILPENISMQDFVFNAGSAAFMTAGMLQSDIELIGFSMENHVIEPLRSQLIPGYTDVKKAAMNAGATGVTISGSGPTLIAVSRPEQREQIAIAMEQAFQQHDILSHTYKTTIGEGIRIISLH
jgi:homoserine kinase